MASDAHETSPEFVIRSCVPYDPFRAVRYSLDAAVQVAQASADTPVEIVQGRGRYAVRHGVWRHGKMFQNLDAAMAGVFANGR